jgi:hypothetical protein
MWFANLFSVEFSNLDSFDSLRFEQSIKVFPGGSAPEKENNEASALENIYCNLIPMT